MASNVNLKASGLVISPNQLELPEGSLVEASNVIIRRDNVIEKRRGFKLYENSFGASTDRAKQIFTYQNQLIRHYSSILEHDNANGSFTAFSGSYLETDVGLRIKSIAANNNCYFTSSEGIKKISSASSDLSGSIITNAGGVKAIDLTGALKYTYASTSGFLPINAAVSYQVVWGTKDANSNLVLGTPSATFQIYNFGEQLIAQDLAYLLSGLDSVGNNAGSGLLSDTNYLNTLNLPITATASQLRTNLIALTSKIDTDLLFADQSLVAPLQIGTVTISNGICTVNFTSGTVTDYLTIGDKVFLAGFNVNNSVKTFNSTTNVNTTTDRITITNHGYIEGDKIVFTGTLPTGISSGTTYYIINPTTNDFQFSTVPGGTPVDITLVAVGTGTATVTSRGSVLNGAQTLTSSTSSTITFTTDAFGDVTTSTATINSNKYRSIDQPSIPNSLATGNDIFSIQSYMDSTILELQSELNSVISTANLNSYIINLGVTKTSTVDLTINIPQSVIDAGLNVYFYQIYRSPISEATGTTSLSDLVPSSELRLVYEAFPTQAEFTAKKIEVEDIVPDSFAGAYLYTNEATGEGALQANDVPPFAKDINYFKNVVFYANTKTRQRKTFSILGISEILNQYDLGNNPSITITDGTSTTTYKFIKGVKEISKLLFGSSGVPAVNTMVSTVSPASYFLINDGKKNEYYVWYKNGPNPTDPAIANKTGIEVDINTTDTNDTVAYKTRDALNKFIDNFSSYLYNISIEQNSTNIVVGTDTFNSTAHGLANNEPVKFETTGSLPSPISSSTLYYIINATANTFQISTTVGGAALNITTTGSGTLKVSEQRQLFIENVIAGITTDSSIGTLPVAYSISTTQQGNGENPATNSILLSDLVSPAQALDETARSLVSVINQNASSPIYAYYLSSVNTVPGKMLFESKILSNSPFYILSSSSNIGSSFSPDISPTNSITNISVANPTVITSAAHGLVNGDIIVISGSNSTPSIDGLYSVMVTGVNTFTVPVNVTVLGTTGAFIKASLSEFSENESKIHRIYYSKKDQPEAVPLLNYFDVGASDKAILRIFPLRDSLFVFKEDGLYRISGELAPFSLALFDSSCILIAADSIGVSNNLIYCWTRQGISTVSEAGVNTVSRAIDTEILKLGSSNYPNFGTATFGIGYESDNSYLVWTVQKTSDTLATICYRYSNLTNTWTTYNKTNTCGKLKGLDDRLYLGAGDTNYIEQERKTFTRQDYADRELAKTLNNDKYFGNKIILSTISDLAIGDVVLQDQTLTVYQYNMLLKKLDLDPGISSTDYYSTLNAVGGNNMRDKLVLLCNKLDGDGLAFTDYFSRIDQKLGSITGVTPGSSAIINSVAHGLLSSRIITISGNTSTPSINGTWEVTVIDANNFSIPTPATTGVADGSWLTPVENFADLKSCYNLTITHLNADTTVAYTNYTLITNNTIQESIIKSINTVTKEITLNLSIDYVVGALSIFKAIDSTFTYAPTTMGDPLNWKHLYEATMMFESKAFTSGTLSFSTDLLPQFIDINFDADSNGIFGHQAFGSGFFGGASHSAPFRTYIPRYAQRCRYINVKFDHNIARENVLCYGITLTGADNVKSSRAYRS